jgi:hypothetical protein
MNHIVAILSDSELLLFVKIVCEQFRVLEMRNWRSLGSSSFDFGFDHILSIMKINVVLAENSLHFEGWAANAGYLL